MKPSSYQELYNNFKWNIPEKFNIGFSCCDRFANENFDKLALIYEDENGNVQKYSYGEIQRLSNKLCNLLITLGIKKGDRFAILLSQQPETLIAHLSGYRMGLICVPLFVLFGEDALEYRLNNSEAKVLILNKDVLEKILAIKDKLQYLEKVIVVGDVKEDDYILEFYKNLNKSSDRFTPLDTFSEEPTLIIYTSGTTGPPKGALHAHRTLLGHLPGVEISHNFFPQKNDFFWTPADWAWIGGLYDVLFPSLYHGIPVLACRMKKFDPEKACLLMEKHKVRNVFMPPTALKILRNVKNIKERFNLKLRTIASGGESLGEETLNWAKDEFGLIINEFYGQTEANMIVSNCAKIMPVKPGSMGKAVPGHIVKIVDENGNVLPQGKEGEIAVKSPDPVMFLEYWKNENATKEKFINEWLLTGDMGKMDEEGYFYFLGRKDDVISSAGYRIGPSEIEDCLIKHPAVSLSAVIGKPDKVRGEIVKAFIVLKKGVKATEELESEIKEFVKKRLSAHEYPREIEFVDSLPMTLTGKIKRKELKMRELKKMERR